MSFKAMVQKEIFENNQLDIYEKMCLMVLVAHDSEEINLSSEELANYMGCGKVTAKRAFDSLRHKGYFAKDYQADPPVASAGEILSSESVSAAAVEEVTKVLDEETDDFREGFFTAPLAEAVVEEQEDQREKVDPEEERRRLLAEYILSGSKAPQQSDQSSSKKSFVSQKENKAQLIDQVVELIDEKISYKEANILLAFAENDIEKIKKGYRMAKQSQVSDTLSVLINYLQKKEMPIIKEKPSQVNPAQLRKMRAYQKGGLNNG